MIIDFVLGALLLFGVVRGFRSGLLKTLLTTIFYLLGGVAGFGIGIHYLENSPTSVKKVALLFLAIVVGGVIGQLFGKALGKFIHAKILWAPIKFLDSLAGGALGIIQSALLIYFLAVLLQISPWTSGQKELAKSQIYPKIEAKVPSAVKNLTTNLHLSRYSSPL